MPAARAERHFLEAIRRRPDGDGPRLAYADWLDGRGDARGRFVRVQCALAGLPRSHPRRDALKAEEAALREAHAAGWAGRLGELVGGYEFRRGLVESVSMSGDAFRDHAAEVLSLAPVRRFRLYDARKNLGRLAQSPHLARVRELDLCGNDLGNGGLHTLLRSRRLQLLELLDLSYNGLSDNGVAQLAASDRLPGLQKLYLNDNGRIGPAGVRALAGSHRLPSLGLLDLGHNDLNDAALTTIVRSPLAGRLTALFVHGNHIGDAGVASLASSRLLARLLAASGRLDLRQNAVGPIGARALAASPAAGAIVELDLAGNYLADQGVWHLTESPHLRRLARLSLRRNRVTDEGAHYLAESELITRLEHLDLTENQLTASGVQELEQVPTRDWRMVLELPEVNDLTPRSTRPRRRRPRPGG